MAILQKLFLQKHLLKNGKWVEASMPIKDFIDVEAAKVYEIVFNKRAAFTFSKHQHCYSILGIESPCVTDYYSVAVTFKVNMGNSQYGNIGKTHEFILFDDELDFLKTYKFQELPIALVLRLKTFLFVPN